MDVTLREQATHAIRPAVVAAPHEPLSNVARRLWEASVGIAVVISDRHGMVGIVSERDIVSQLASGADPSATTAEQAMTRHIISARPDDPLLDVAFLMIDGGVRHIPVLDVFGHLEGVVSIRDLLRPLLVETLSGSADTPPHEEVIR